MFKTNFNFKDPSTRSSQVRAVMVLVRDSQTRTQRSWDSVVLRLSGLVTFHFLSKKMKISNQAGTTKILNFRTGPNHDENHSEPLSEQISTELLIGEVCFENISCDSHFGDRSKSFVIRHDRFPDLESQVKKNPAIWKISTGQSERRKYMGQYV